MLGDEPDPASGPITVEQDAYGVRMHFPEGTWGVHFSSRWHMVRSDEEDLWCWTSGELRGRIRLRRHPRVQIEVDVHNTAPDVAQVDSPQVELSTVGNQVPWLAGSAGEVLMSMSEATVLWVQQRGSCVPGAEGFTLFADPLLLRPGQGSSAVWRRNVFPPASMIPEPDWVPRLRYLPVGDVLEVEHADAALTGEGVQLATTMDGSQVGGEPGLHHLSFLDARGTASMEVGWFDSLTEIAGSRPALADADPNLVAWLLAATIDTAEDLDPLDLTLGDALSSPTAWGVLAGMRAATRTDLPVAAEVKEAARTIWEGETDPHLRSLMITHAWLCGWEPEVVRQWLASPAAIGDVSKFRPQEMLASVGFGRITSAATLCTGRDVALAGMWLSACPESVKASEWEHAVEVSRRRLMCALSNAPIAADIAWLLAYSLMT
ncbi:MAG: hypothetical protein ACTHWA_06370 [Arachnia sp.]